VKVNTLAQKVAAAIVFRRKTRDATPPRFLEGARIPYGPFRFKAQVPKGVVFTILASTDLSTWETIANESPREGSIEHVDADASKFSYRFYRIVSGGIASENVIGFASVTLPPGFSLISNPFDAANNSVSDLFRNWPDGTTLNKFDTRLFRLGENQVRNGKWSNPTETLSSAEAAIFFNPTSEYKSHSFAGDVVQGNLTIPIPSGFSMRGSLVPKPGNLTEDLGFPITDGDVIHIFDRDRQKYAVHPFHNGTWTTGPPVLSVGEGFWVAKAQPGNWSKRVTLSD
jgi:hypothetical protein